MALDLSDALQQLDRSAASTDLTTLDGRQIRELTAAIRRAERSLTSLTVRVGQRSSQLAVDAAGPDAEATFLGTGEVSGNRARQDAGRSQVATDMPALGDALHTGTVSGEHLDVVNNAAKRLDPEIRQRFNEQANELAEAAERMPVDTFRRHVQRAAEAVALDHGLAEAKRQREASELRTWIDRSGMGQIRGQLDPERYAQFVNAIQREASALASAAKQSGEAVTKGPGLDAAAMVELVTASNAAAGRADITVVVDADTAINGPHEHSIRETADGQELAYETVRRLSCDAVIQRVVLDSNGAPLDVGRTYRTATPRQWVALKAIYRTCAWAGCDRPISWCQAHVNASAQGAFGVPGDSSLRSELPHIDEWEHGGATDLDNLVPLCSRHHHAVHEGGWNLKLLPDRTLRIFDPAGRHHATAWPDRFELHARLANPPERERSNN